MTRCGVHCAVKCHSEYVTLHLCLLTRQQPELNITVLTQLLVL
jgi:hypothetical protein